MPGDGAEDEDPPSARGEPGQGGEGRLKRTRVGPCSDVDEYRVVDRGAHVELPDRHAVRRVGELRRRDGSGAEHARDDAGIGGQLGGRDVGSDRNVRVVDLPEDGVEVRAQVRGVPRLRRLRELLRVPELRDAGRHLCTEGTRGDPTVDRQIAYFEVVELQVHRVRVGQGDLGRPVVTAEGII